MSNGKTEQVQQGMEEYLKKTYEKEFVVREPYLTGNEGLGYIYQTKAYPKGQPELEFFVEGDRSNTGAYIDGYLQVLWTYQGRQELEQALKQLYGSDFTVEKFEFRYNNPEYKDLKYSEVIKQCDGWAYIAISYAVFMDNKIDKKIEAQKAHKLIKSFLIDNKIKRYDLAISFHPAELKDSANNIANEINSHRKSLDDLYKEKKLINFIHIYDVALKENEIKKVYVDDIVKSFRFE